jgi:hypothetical protein
VKKCPHPDCGELLTEQPDPVTRCHRGTNCDHRISAEIYAELPEHQPPSPPILRWVDNIDNRWLVAVPREYHNIQAHEHIHAMWTRAVRATEPMTEGTLRRAFRAILRR